MVAARRDLTMSVQVISAAARCGLGWPDRCRLKHPLHIRGMVLFTIHRGGAEMVDLNNELPEPRQRVADSEKITINLGYVDLGRIDLMVRDGFYSNRTDFIRTAIRNQLASHADAVRQSIVRRTLELGLRRIGREELEAVKATGGRLNIQVLGLATIDEDVTPELARATIESITVLGALHASKSIKSALAERIR